MDTAHKWGDNKIAMTDFIKKDFGGINNRGSHPVVLSCQVKWAFQQVVQTATVGEEKESIIHDTESYLIRDSQTHTHSHTVSQMVK